MRMLFRRDSCRRLPTCRAPLRQSITTSTPSSLASTSCSWPTWCLSRSSFPEPSESCWRSTAWPTWSIASRPCWHQASHPSWSPGSNCPRSLVKDRSACGSWWPASTSSNGRSGRARQPGCGPRNCRHSDENCRLNPCASRPGDPCALDTGLRHHREGPQFPVPADRDRSFDGLDPFRPAVKRLPPPVRWRNRVGYRGGSGRRTAPDLAARGLWPPASPRRPALREPRRLGGLLTIVLGIGPRTMLDLTLNAALLLTLVVGLAITLPKP